MNEAMKQKIENGEVFLGIELGSTRIKAVLIDNTYAPIASGGYNWENRLEDGYWTYHLDDVWTGVQTSFRELAKDVSERYGAALTKVASMGVSAMMHGYLAFDKEGNQLCPFAPGEIPLPRKRPGCCLRNSTLTCLCAGASRIFIRRCSIRRPT